jgi:hypothetical protein
MNVNLCPFSMALLAVSVAVACVSCGAQDYPLREPQWPGKSVRIDLTRYGKYLPHVEFSTDSTMVCAFWETTHQHGSTTVGPPLKIVFDIHGEIVPGTVSAKGGLTEAYIRRFPRSVARVSGMVHDPLADSLKLSTPYPDFLQGAGGWGFNNDFSLGIRQVKPRSAWNGRPNQDLHEDSGFALWTLELWRLLPKKEQVWNVELPEPTAAIEDVLFFRRDGKNLMALATHPGEGYILSLDDGRVVSRIRYNSFDSERPPKNAISDDSAGPFKASQFSFDPSRDWLACGTSEGRGVRVFSLHSSAKLIFETNVYDNPHLPKGGKWSVEHVEFAAGGQYLVVERHFGGRGTGIRVNATEVFETKTWRKVWWKNSEYISSVCVSPDGKKMAFVRSNFMHNRSFLEIGSFVETED